jgi:DNA replication protein DnaC
VAATAIEKMELGPALNDDGDIYDRCGNFVGHMSDLRTSSGVFELADLQKKTNQASHVTFHSDDLTEDEGDFALKLQNVTNLADLDSSPEMFLLKRQHSSDKRSDIEVTSPSRPSIKRNLTGAPAAKRHYHAADSSPILGSWGKPQTSSTSETKFAKDKKDKSLLESTLGTGNGEEPAFRSETNHATTQMSMPLTWSSSPAYHKYATLANRNAPQTNDVASKDTHNTDARLKASVTEENLSLSTCGPAEPTRFIRHDSETGVVAEQLAEDKMDPYDNDGGNTVYDGAIAGEDFYPEEPIMATSSELVRRPDINEPIGVTQVTEHASRHFKANPTYDHQNGTHVENIQCAQPKMYKGEDKQIFLGKRTKGGQSRLQTYFSETSKERGLENLERENKASEELATKHPIAKIFLSREQKCILDMVVKEQRNVFFTGAAGTGKSVLLRKIISDLKKKYSKNPNYVAVTASTGLAACNIGGITLHSFAGIGLGTDPVDRLVTKVRRNRKIFQRWKDVKVLIVDELSMIDGALLDKLNDLAQRLRRKKGIPFGGIQIVVTGDFFQLPPVVKDAEELRFAFEADCWNEIVDDTMVLTQVFRQKDNRFSTMLNEMRRGQMSDETVRTLQSLNRPPKVPDGISPTQLFPRRYEVDASNQAKLRQLSGKTITYTCDDQYANDE